MRQRLSDWERKRLFKYLYVPVCLADGRMDLSLKWKNPKKPTFPYDPEKHEYNVPDDGLVIFSSIMWLGVRTDAQVISAVHFGDEVNEKSSKIPNFESVSYHLGIYA